MNIIIEASNRRRTIDSGGFKVYGSRGELTQLRDAIEEALKSGLVQGWVGVGHIDDPKTVFPFNGIEGIPSSPWEDKAEVV